MNEFTQLGERLRACAGFVRKGSRLADIGTDHAYLPVLLVEKGIAPFAIASDVNDGPIKRAAANIARAGLSDRIRTITADGLDGIAPGEVDDIVIAGMGGELIAAILSRAEWIRDRDCRLVLQPMSRAERLREWLCRNGFEIEDEKAVLDAGKYYSVICASYSGSLREDELFWHGGRLLGKEDDISREYLKRHSRSLIVRAAGLRLKAENEQAERLERIAGLITGFGERREKE